MKYPSFLLHIVILCCSKKYRVKLFVRDNQYISGKEHTDCRQARNSNHRTHSWSISPQEKYLAFFPQWDRDAFGATEAIFNEFS